jgi:hypothetical protein
MANFNFKTVKLSDFIANDDNGNSFVKSFGFDEDGNHVATTFGCDKENCSCVGSWTDGFAEDVVCTVNRADV